MTSNDRAAGSAEMATQRFSSRMRKASRKMNDDYVDSSLIVTKEKAAAGGINKTEAQQRDDEAVDENEELEIFCTCRKGDDGKPMISCGQCNEWFHFRCVGLTKKLAENIAEYVCRSCEKSTGLTSQSNDGKALTSTGTEASTLPSARDNHQSQDEVTPASSMLVKRKREKDEHTQDEQDDSTTRATATSSKRSASQQSMHKLQSSPPHIRKTSVSRPVPQTSSSARSGHDPLRKHALQQFSEIFVEILTTGDVVKYKGNVKEIEVKAQEYARDFETALFDVTSDTTSSSPTRSAGKAYRDKLRSFMFNLKDKSNTSLRSRIAKGILPAAQLANLSNEEMANDDIRQEVERRKRENLQQSIMKKEIAPLRKLTHKGEIDIEYENAQQAQRIADDHERNVHADRRAVGLTALATSTPSQGEEQTSMQSTEHVKAQSPTIAFDFSTVWQGDRSPTGEQVTEEDQSEGEAEIAGNEGDDNVKDEQQQDNTDEQRPDNFIDTFLGLPDGKQDSPKDEIAKDDASDAVEAESTSTAIPSPHQWKGAFHMPDEGAFTSAVTQIAGRKLLPNEWSNLFPDTVSLIEGRLPTKSAEPYLLQSRIAMRTELVAFAAKSEWVEGALNGIPSSTSPPQPSSEVDASESPAERNASKFTSMLAYFIAKDRYGVLKPAREARGRFVKDFYLMALPKTHAVPSWLELMEFDQSVCPALPTERKDDMFVLVAVLFKQTTQQPQVDLTAAGKSPGQGETPPVTNAALQDLLRAVGGSRTTSIQSPFDAGRSPGQHAVESRIGYQPLGAMSTSSVEALSGLPKPQLEDVLTKNPSLVDDLLKTLGRPSMASPGGPLPPGPPPARPAGMPLTYGTPTYASPPYGDSAVGYNGGGGGGGGGYQSMHARPGAYPQHVYGAQQTGGNGQAQGYGYYQRQQQQQPYGRPPPGYGAPP